MDVLARFDGCRCLCVGVSLFVLGGCGAADSVDAADSAEAPLGESVKKGHGQQAVRKPPAVDPAVDPAADPAVDPDDPAPTVVASGSTSIVTYNVAGLPSVVSGGNPDNTSPAMGEHLNAYEIALVQEDFSYHEALASNIEHPYQTTPMPTDSPLDFGDGLNRFSQLAFVDHEREAWDACNGLLSDGNDCLTAKGFSVATHAIAAGLEVDVYNLHMDAGRSGADQQARSAQVVQLLAFITEHSPAGRPIIVAGDTNMKAEDESQLLELMDQAELTDACRVLECDNPTLHDRILFRGTDEVLLSAQSWTRENWQDSSGEPLSDHDPVVAVMDWAIVDPSE